MFVMAGVADKVTQVMQVSGGLQQFPVLGGQLMEGPQ
jgi:hypothetical protein